METDFLKQEMKNKNLIYVLAYEVVVSKETVVLRRWGRETQNFGFIN